MGLIVAAPAGAATITVTTTEDRLNEGSCSLREAIATVDGTGHGFCGAASPSGNTIVLAAATYPLTRMAFLILGKPEGCISISKEGPDDNSRGELAVAENVKELTIEGAGPGQTILDACKLDDRALQVKPGAGVTLKGLTITNGHAPNGADGTAGVVNGGTAGAAEPGEDGGGILDEGSLTLTDTAITGNHAGSGGTGGKGAPLDGSGGIGGAGGSGGAIAIFATGTLTVSESTISANTAGDGGAGGEATVGSTEGGLNGNGGSGASGGNGGGAAGIANLGGTATIEKSIIAANIAGNGGAGTSGKDSAAAEGNGGNGGNGGTGGNGGGIAIAGALFKPPATLQATDDTIQGNIAGDGANAGDPGNGRNKFGKGGDGGDGGFGGGVENLLNTATQLVNLTIAENAAGHAGTGGAESPDFPAGTNGTAGHGGGVYGLTSPTLQNTILYENQTGGDCRGSIVDGGRNLVFSKPSLKGIVTDPCSFTSAVSEDPKLALLAANGGPTETMRLQAGSPAIDQVPAAGAGCPATDQRGVGRPGGTACDIGAYEVVVPVIANVGASAIGTSGAMLSATVTADAPAATVQFQYGTTTAYGSSTTPQSASGLTPVGLLAQVSALAPGTTYHLRVIATSQDGTSASADQTFTTAAAAPRFTTAAAAPSAPVLTKVAESNHRWRDGTRLASVAGKVKRPPVGTTFSFTLNEAASVSFSFTQRVGGRKVKGKCVAQTKKNRHKHACKRTVTRGAVSLVAHAGTNKALFQGRISHALKLKPGAYVVVITATNSAGQRSVPARLSFTVVR